MEMVISEKIQEQLAGADKLARSRPLRYPGEPRQVDMLLQIALENAEWGSREIVASYQERIGSAPRVSVNSLLRRNYLLKPQGRQECLAAIARQKVHIRTLLWSADPTQISTAMTEINTERRQMRLSSVIVSRFVLRDLAHDLKGSRSAKEANLGRQLNNVLDLLLLPGSDKLYRNIMRGAVEARGLGRPVSVDEALGDLIQQVDDISGEDEEGTSSEPELLAEENAILRSALFGLRQELVSLQEELRKTQQTTQEDVVADFLREMNSPVNNNLLDNVMLSNRAAGKLFAKGWMPDLPEVEGIVYSLKLLADFLADKGVQPIQQIGSRVSVTLSDLAKVSYIGSEFSNPQESKEVEFRTPGWLYHQQIVTRPQAVEIDPLSIEEEAR